MVSLVLLVLLCKAMSFSGDLTMLMQKFNHALNPKINKSMLDSPDHCESSIYPSLKTVSQKPHAEEASPIKDCGDVLKDEDTNQVKDSSRCKASTKSPCQDPMNTSFSTTEQDISNENSAQNPFRDHNKSFGCEAAASQKEVPWHDIENHENISKCNGEDKVNLQHFNDISATEKKIKDHSSRLSKEKELASQIKEIKRKIDLYAALLKLERDTNATRNTESRAEGYDWSPRKKRVVVPGKPRKVKVIKIIPRPVDEEGSPWHKQERDDIKINSEST